MTLFKKIQKLFLSCMTSILLCSYTTTSTTNQTIESTNSYSESNIDEELKKLDSRLDEFNIMGESHMNVENQLNDKDINFINQFVIRDENKLLLNNEVYKEMPINNLGLSAEDYKLEMGYEFPIESNVDYLVNYKKLSFVADNIDFMNYMVENECGKILDNGTMEFHCDEFIQQSFIMNFHLGWFKMTFTANYWATIFFGAMGLLINLTNLKDVKKLMNSSKDDFEKCFIEVGKDLINDSSTYWGNLITQNALTAASEVASILSIASTATWLGKVCKILQYILSHYLPGFIKGAAMVMSGLLNNYGSDVEIGVWWSNYNILYYKVK